MQKATGRGQKKTTKKRITRKKVSGKVDTAGNRNESAELSTAASSGSRSVGSQTSSGVTPDSQNTAEGIPGTSPAEPVTTVGNAQGKSGGATSVSWIALCLGAAALGVGGYVWYVSAVQTKVSTEYQVNRVSLLEQRVENFDTLQADFVGQVSLLKRQVTQAEDNFSNQLRTIRSELAEKDSEVQQLIRSSGEGVKDQIEDFRQDFEILSDSILTLRSELGRGLDNWILEEVEQLIFIANQRLQFAGDHVLARKALQIADDRLRERADPLFSEVRLTLAGEISELEKIQDVDITGVLSAITALSENLGDLRLAGDLYGPGISGPERNELESEESDQQSTDSGNFFQPVINAVTALLVSLGDMIQVEKNGEAIKPVISAEIRQLIYTRGRLILDSSQIALLRQNPDLFEERIALAKEWVEGNFDLESEMTRRWLSKLDEIASQSPRSTLPDISGSLNLLRKIMSDQG